MLIHRYVFDPQILVVINQLGAIIAIFQRPGCRRVVAVCVCRGGLEMVFEGGAAGGKSKLLF